MDANWLMVALLSLISSIAIYVGRMLFKRWFNPLSIYSAIWGFCLCNYELRLIQYYPISTTAWTYIALAWMSLYLGAATALLLSSRRDSAVIPVFRVNLTLLKRMVFALSVLGAVGLVGQLIAVSRQFGNPLIALIVNSGDVYGARISGELSGLNYIGDCSFAACTLAGIYTARVARITVVAMAPITLVALQLLALAGRTGLGVAAILLMVSFVYTPRPLRFQISKWQGIVGTALIVTLLAGSFILVSSVRHLDGNFPGITPAMEEISTYVPPFPSLYSNFSATPVALSLYLSSSQENRTGFWGMYTAAPVWRFLSHLGFRTEVAPYEENYYTPVPMNTGTYLKNVHSDFGFAGILLFPYLLGWATTFFIIRASVTPTLLGLVVLSNVFVLVVFSFAFNFMLLGDWYIALVVDVVAAFVVDRWSYSHRNTASLVPVNANA